MPDIIYVLLVDEYNSNNHIKKQYIIDNSKPVQQTIKFIMNIIKTNNCVQLDIPANLHQHIDQAFFG